MDVPEFLKKLRQRAGITATLADPLEQAQRFIDAKGDTGEGRALLGVVQALHTGEGKFSESDLYSFGNDSLLLISALIDARAAGKYPEWKWHRAASYPPWRFLLDLQRKYGIR